MTLQVLHPRRPLRACSGRLFGPRRSSCPHAHQERQAAGLNHTPTLRLTALPGNSPRHPCPLAVVTGELALAAPALGTSQRLLNKDHAAPYYEGMPAMPDGRWVAPQASRAGRVGMDRSLTAVNEWCRCVACVEIGQHTSVIRKDACRAGLPYSGPHPPHAAPTQALPAAPWRRGGAPARRLLPCPGQVRRHHEPGRHQSQLR